MNSKFQRYHAQAMNEAGETLRRKARAFRALHESDQTFIMPNAWDPGTAILFATAGFDAIATTSGGVNWSRGREDYVYEVAREEMLYAYTNIAQAVDVPVSADLENGYGATPKDVAETVRLAIGGGLVGGGIEDAKADPTPSLFELDEAIERLTAAREAADATGISFTLTARCEAFFMPCDEPLEEAIRRANRYREVGADCIFVPGPNDAETIGVLVREIDAPLSQVVGLGDPPLTVSALRDLGVRRISTGGSLARAALATVQRAIIAMRNEGRFDYAGEAISDPAINALFKEYQLRRRGG